MKKVLTKGKLGEPSHAKGKGICLQKVSRLTKLPVQKTGYLHKVSMILKKGKPIDENSRAKVTVYTSGNLSGIPFKSFMIMFSDGEKELSQ